jgi:cysteine-rich secretory family protein
MERTPTNALCSRSTRPGPRRRDGSRWRGDHHRRAERDGHQRALAAARPIHAAAVLTLALALLLCGLNAAGATAATADGCAGAHLVPTATNVARIQAATLCLIDAQRRAHGLRPLRQNADLQSAAQAHAAQMVTRDYFNHVGPGGDSPLQRAIATGYASRSGIRDLGENIAAASGSLATPAASVRAWMHSAAHRAQILNPAFRDTGIGVVAALPRSLRLGRSGATYAEDFGTRD